MIMISAVFKESFGFPVAGKQGFQARYCPSFFLGGGGWIGHYHK